MSEFKDINELFQIGVYADLEVIIHKPTGYINGTKLCKQNNSIKLLYYWFARKFSKIIIEEMGKDIGKDVIIKDFQQCNGELITNQTKGTYLHPRLTTCVILWNSPKYCVKASKIIEEWKNKSRVNTTQYWNDVSECMDECLKNMDSKQEQKERKYRDMIAKREEGKIEVRVKGGIIDVLTTKKIIEVKPANQWKHAMGQVLCYRENFKDRKAYIYLFEYKKCDKNFIRKVCRKYRVRVKFVKIKNEKIIYKS